MPSKDAGKSADQAAQAQTRLAEQLVSETSPLRRELIGDASGFLRGRDVTGLPEFAAGKSVLEPQFANARESIIANTPEGGGLTSALAQLEGDRARGLTQMTGSLASNEIDRALQLATFGAAQGTAGLGGAAFSQAQRAAAEAQSNAGKGQAAGVIAAAAIAKSDRRLKRNICRVGSLGPYNLYAYTIGGRFDLGVMADEVPERYRVMGADGYEMVNYGALIGEL
jgi:hypothetical protein